MSNIDDITNNSHHKRKKDLEQPLEGTILIADEDVRSCALGGSSKNLKTEEKLDLPPRNKKQRGAFKDELLKLSKEELVERLIQAEAHIFQLKNIINRNLSDNSETEKVQLKKQQKKFDFSKCHYRPILLKLMYYGWDYNGFVVQEDTLETIEHHLFKALTKTCLVESRETSKYHRCGRTDKGVSAFGQVISLTVRSKQAPDKRNDLECVPKELDYCGILNRLLPKLIRAIAWMPVDEEFSARFDCKQRQYKYYFPRSSLNIAAMRQACRHLVGSHDFRNLCKMDVGNGVVEYKRNILAADVVPFDDEDVNAPTSMYYLIIEGNAFLWHQIRCIQAVLLLIGEGLEKTDVVLELLNVDKYPGKPVYNMAADVPLNLFNCSYDIDDTKWMYERANLEKLIIHWQEEWTLQNIKATMMMDCLQRLEAKYREVAGDEAKIFHYHQGLTQGVRPTRYRPLLNRPTCPTLSQKIEHARKRRKFDNV